MGFEPSEQEREGRGRILSSFLSTAQPSFPSSFLPKPPSSKTNHQQPGKLFIGGIPDGTTAEALREYASEFGALSDVAVMEGRGFAFVTFADPAHARSFLEVRDETEKGLRRRVMRGRGRERESEAERENPKKLALALDLARSLARSPILFWRRAYIPFHPDRALFIPAGGSRRAKGFRSCGWKSNATSKRGLNLAGEIGEGHGFFQKREAHRAPLFSWKVKKKKKHTWTVQKSSCFSRDPL